MVPNLDGYRRYSPSVSDSDDPIGILKLDAKDFGSIGDKMKSLALPTLVVQEGGYGIDAIQDCLDAFLTGFSGA